MENQTTEDKVAETRVAIVATAGIIVKNDNYSCRFAVACAKLVTAIIIHCIVFQEVMFFK